jgi:hypothetical protein
LLIFANSAVPLQALSAEVPNDLLLYLEVNQRPNHKVDRHPLIATSAELCHFSETSFRFIHAVGAVASTCDSSRSSLTLNPRRAAPG